MQTLPVQWTGQQAVVTLPQHIDHSNADQIREQLLWLINRGAAVLVADLTGTVSCDNCAIDALARAYVRAVENGTELRLVVASYGVRRVLSSSGRDRIIPVYTDVEATVPALPGRREARGEQESGTADRVALAEELLDSVAPTRQHPFTVIAVDEVAFLTAYQPDRKLRERTMNALATLTTQGPAVGYCVVAALQDPRKDVLTIRNLFPDRIAMRLDEPEQVDMVLGDGARDRGAACELISTDPATGAGVAFVRQEADPDPVRVRAVWVTDADIRDMAGQCAEYAGPLRIGAAA